MNRKEAHTQLRSDTLLAGGLHWRGKSFPSGSPEGLGKQVLFEIQDLKPCIG